jgi:hypothetical protein
MIAPLDNLGPFVREGHGCSLEQLRPISPSGYNLSKDYFEKKGHKSPYSKRIKLHSWYLENRSLYGTNL